jgi:hypothetical protein
VVRRFGDKRALLLPDQVPGVSLLVREQFFDLLLDRKYYVICASLKVRIPDVAWVSWASRRVFVGMVVVRHYHILIFVEGLLDDL